MMKTPPRTSCFFISATLLVLVIHVLQISAVGLKPVTTWGFSEENILKKYFVNKTSTWLQYGGIAKINEDIMSPNAGHTDSFSGGNAKLRRRRETTPMDEHREDLPNEVFAYGPGDYNLGAMFAVNYPNRDDPDPNPCSRILNLSGMRIESMLYAIDCINNRTDILPNVKLGFEIRNDCSDQNQALQEAMTFLPVNEYDTCISEEAQTIGVVGTGTSVTSSAVANLLGLFKVPQISYSASSPVLSNKNIYPYFARTIASDVNQVQVMADLAEDMGWNYVAIIFTDDTYGQPGMEELTSLLQARHICVAVSLGLSIFSPDAVVGNIISEIKNDSKISVIFTFCLKHDIEPLLNEAHRQGLYDRTWIASDSWSGSIQTIEGVEPVVTGMLGVVPKSSYEPNFQRYLSNLNPWSNARNPWYQLTLAEQFNCTFDAAADPSRKPCTGAETFANINDTNTQFVIDAVYAFAYGLDDLISAKYNGSDEIMRQLDLETYLQYVKSVNFVGLTNSNFKFDENGDPMAQYELHNLQQHDQKYSIVRVADWDPTMRFNNWEQVVWKEDTGPPLSRCSPDCPAGYFITLQTIKCCWACHACEAGSVSPDVNSLLCTKCNDGAQADPERKFCLVNPISYLKWSHPVAIVLVIFTGLGLVATGFTLGIYIRYRNSATIKATSTELSYMLLVGISLSYLCTFLYIAMPTDVICNAQIFGVGIGFSVYVSALLTKTNRISLIFNRKLSNGSPSPLLNIQYQLLFALSIVALQTALQLIWLQLQPGVAVMDTSDPEVTMLVCHYASYIGPAVAIGLNALLALLCMYKAFKTRKLPGQFNDSRGICFAMFTCCLIWFVFFTSYFMSSGMVNSIVCSVAFIASGTSGLICMFFPKIWIVVLRPDRNIPQSTMQFNTTNGPGSGSGDVTTVSGAVSTPVRDRRASSTPSSPNLSSGGFDGISPWDINEEEEEDEQRLIEDIEKIEEQLREAGRERDEAVTRAREMHEEMLKLQMQNEEMRNPDADKLGEDSSEEVNNDEDSGLDDKEDAGEEVSELTVKLETALAKQDILSKKVKELQLECQHWKNITSRANNDTATVAAEIGNATYVNDGYF